MRIKLDQILVHVGLEICTLSKSVRPLGTFVTYSSHLSLYSCCREDKSFFEKRIYISAILLLVFIFLHAYTQKPKNLFYIIFPVKLANQYLQLLTCSTTFSLLKGTATDLLHLGVINYRVGLEYISPSWEGQIPISIHATQQVL
jgi:hypothetical protein